ncbi:MAG: ATP phosphoribosyltransferase [Acidimicrobiia bacterium]|nr:ATP phosphoribosyltransferase [Acidimicrobiia bacterium]MBP8180753.1 ATP phosphoribosyltransferase [Acidimicrobiia bacterium]
MVRVAIPSKGRLRSDSLSLLAAAGVSTGMFHGSGARVVVDGIEYIEMRPRDAAIAIANGQLDGAILATDIILEAGVSDLPNLPLGFSRSQLVVASRADDGRSEAADLAGGGIATHLPAASKRWFDDQGIDVQILSMGGSLEGVCASGMADGIVDLRETGTSLAMNNLRVLAVIADCQATAVWRSDAPVITDLIVRLEAALQAKQHRYVMMHLELARIPELCALFPGLAAPTILPLAGRDDLVAVHIVVDGKTWWRLLQDVRALGATAIVALQPSTLLM